MNPLETSILRHQNQYSTFFTDFHQKGQTILMVTHEVKSACRGERILYFRDGGIIDELRIEKAETKENKEKGLDSMAFEKRMVKKSSLMWFEVVRCGSKGTSRTIITIIYNSNNLEQSRTTSYKNIFFMTHSVFIIAWSYLKRRKWQSILVGICIVLSALLFSTTLGLLQGIHKPFDVMYDQLNASHLLLIYDHREVKTEEIQSWFKAQKEVISVAEALPFVSLNSSVIFEEQELDLSIQLMERIPNSLGQDQVFFVEGTPAPYPKMGEIWLPDHLANSHGIEIGDSIGIPTNEGFYHLKVFCNFGRPTLRQQFI